RIGTTASAASHADDGTPAGGACGGGPGAVVASWVIRSLLGTVVTRFECRHLPGRLLRPARIARAVADNGPDRESGAEQRPTLVLLDLNAHRHTLNDLGE